MKSMYLYGDNSDSVKVYEMIPKNKKIDDFRRQVLDNQIYSHIEKVSLDPFNGSERHTIFYPFKEHDEMIDMSQVNFKGPIKKYEKAGSLELNQDESIKREYVNGELNNPRLIVVKDIEKIRYFLLRYNELYHLVSDENYGLSFKINPILEINKSLYNLEKLLQRKFIALKEEDLKEELQLFDIILRDCISKIELAKMSIYVDSTGSDIINNNIPKDAIILSKIKK